MKGPYTLQRDATAEKYQDKAECIVRFFDNLGMTREEKIKYLADTFASLEMYFAMNNTKMTNTAAFEPAGV